MSCYIATMAANAFVPDAVWEGLDPSGARLSREQRLRVAAWSVAGLIAIVGFLVAFASGLFIPRVVAAVDLGSSGNRIYTVHAAITNDGWVAERVSDVRIVRPGLVLESGTPAARTIESGATVNVVFRVRLVSCSSVRPAPLSVAARVSPPWGPAGTRTLGHTGPFFFSGLWAACHDGRG